MSLNSWPSLFALYWKLTLSFQVTVCPHIDRFMSSTEHVFHMCPCAHTQVFLRGSWSAQETSADRSFWTYGVNHFTSLRTFKPVFELYVLMLFIKFLLFFLIETLEFFCSTHKTLIKRGFLFRRRIGMKIIKCPVCFLLLLSVLSSRVRPQRRQRWVVHQVPLCMCEFKLL